MTYDFLIPFAPLPTSNMMMPISIPLKDALGRKTGKTRTALMYDNDAQKYLARVVSHLQAQRMQLRMTRPLRVRLAVTCVVWRPREAGDVDNYHKGVLDCTQKAGIVENDRLYKDLRVIVKTDPANPRMTIHIQELAHDGDLFQQHAEAEAPSEQQHAQGIGAPDESAGRGEGTGQVGAGQPTR